jgi:hypothetical protein
VNEDKVVGYIYSTKEYSKFKIMPNNRKLVSKNLTKLRLELSEFGQIQPIVVNENFEIIDGQHRFEVLKELEFAVVYIINKGSGIGEVISTNSVNAIWQGFDFINTHKDKSTYQSIIKFQKDYPKLTTKPLLAILFGSSYITNELRQGLAQIPDITQSYFYANEIEVISQFNECAYSIKFVSAYLKIRSKIDIADFFSELIQKLKQTGLHNSLNSKDFMIQIEEIYNYRRSNKINLRF